MRIAVVAPPWLSVPPKRYGGTEIVVYNLTEELVKRGHKVTLFATLDSESSAKLCSPFKKALGIEALRNRPHVSLLHYIECFKKADSFDVIHNHDEHIAPFLADLVNKPIVHTIHASFTKNDTTKWEIEAINRFYYHNFVSISLNQQKDLKKLKFIANVYNGIDTNKYEFLEEKKEYLFWMGRFVDKKGPREAIIVSKRLNIPLILAGRVEPFERPFFDKKIKPEIDGKLIKFVGEVGVEEKVKLFSKAICTLSPIKWQEPFGLVMAESLSCGVPVVAFNKGSVKEIIENNVSGFVIDSKKGIPGLIEAVRKIDKIDRLECRKRAVEKFDTKVMTDQYETIYSKLIKARNKPLDIPRFAVHN